MALDTFGKRLKLLRVDRGLMQTELREQMQSLYGVEIGETYLSELERTNKMPVLSVAVAIAKALDVSLDYLGLLIDEAVSYRRETAPVYFSPEADEIAQLVDAMRPEQRSVILALVRSLPAPQTERQRKLATMAELLDLIEGNVSHDARTEFEKIMRNKGFFVEDNS